MWSRWIDLLREKGVSRPESVARLLAELFYSLKGALAGMSYGSEWQEFAAQRRGVGSPEFFDRYFQARLPAGDVSEKVVNAAVAELRANDVSTAVEELRDIMRRDTELVMSKLWRRHKVEPLPAKGTLDLLAAGYTDAMEQKSGPLGLSPDFRMLMLASELLDSGSVQDALTFVQTISTSLEGLNLVADLIHRAKGRQEPEPAWVVKATPLVAELIKARLNSVKAIKLEESSRYDFRLIWSLASIISQAEMREFVLTLLAGETAWTIQDFLASLVPIGIAGDGRHQWESMGDLQATTLTMFFEPEQLFELLGDSPFPEGNSQDAEYFDRRREAPTWEARIEYALRVAQKLRPDEAKAAADSVGGVEP
jgi:hypothetical protein